MAINYDIEDDLIAVAERAVKDSSCFQHHLLKGYNCLDPQNSNLLFQVAYCEGGACLCFPIRKGKVLKCLRVWKFDSVREQYWDHIKQVGDFFNNTTVNYVVNFSYLENAIVLQNGVVIPAVLMDWVDDKTMGDYVCQCVKKKLEYKIDALAENFLKMCEYHKRYGMAHGDLSLRNILVKENGEIVLIDYDSFFYHKFKKEVPPIKGTRGYQHPDRLGEKKSNWVVNSKSDYFSQLVIYLSLIAIAQQPLLFNSSNIEDGCILFLPQDLESYNNLIASETYKKLSGINDPKIKYVLGKLVKAIKGPLDKVPSIVDVMSEYDFVIPRLRGILGAIISRAGVNKDETKMHFCGLCGHRFESTIYNYCPQCGTGREKSGSTNSNMTKRCGRSGCGHVNATSSHYCVMCGNQLGISKYTVVNKYAYENTKSELRKVEAERKRLEAQINGFWWVKLKNWFGDNQWIVTLLGFITLCCGGGILSGVGKELLDSWWLAIGCLLLLVGWLLCIINAGD